MTEVESEKQMNTLTKNTNITVGLAISILMSIVGAIGAGAWWAATITSKMDQFGNVIEDHSRRITVLEQSTLKAEHIRPLVHSIVQEVTLGRNP